VKGYFNGGRFGACCTVDPYNDIEESKEMSHWVISVLYIIGVTQAYIWGYKNGKKRSGNGVMK
jgi:hypothetical protein